MLRVLQPRPPAQLGGHDEPHQLREHRGPRPGSRIEKPSTIRGEPHLHLDWFGQPPTTNNTIPLTLFTEPCVLRSRIVDALNASHTPWRIAYEGAELVGLRAATKAGLGVTCLIANSDTLCGLPRTTNLPLPQPPDPIPVTLTIAPTLTNRQLVHATKEALYDSLNEYPFAA